MSKTFGERLQHHRKRAKFTLESLAKEVDSTKSYIWELENKPNIRPSAELVYRLATKLGTTVGVLMGELEPADFRPKELTEPDRLFFRNYQELNPKTKKRLKDIMDILSEEDDK